MGLVPTYDAPYEDKKNLKYAVSSFLASLLSFYKLPFSNENVVKTPNCHYLQYAEPKVLFLVRLDATDS